MSAHTRTPLAELDCQHTFAAIGEPMRLGDAVRTAEPSGDEWFGQCVFTAHDVSVVLIKAVDARYGYCKMKPGERIAFYFS